MRVEHRVAAIAARMALLEYADTVLTPEMEEEMVGFLQRQFTDDILRKMKHQEKERARHGRKAKRAK